MSYGSERVLGRVEGTLRDPRVSRTPRARTTAGNPSARHRQVKGNRGGYMKRHTGGTLMEWTAKGGEGLHRTFHSDVTSYSGTRAACNERFRNCSSVVHRRRASSDLERERFYAATIRVHPSVVREFGGSVATFVSKTVNGDRSVHDRHSSCKYEKTLARRVPSKNFLAKDSEDIRVIWRSGLRNITTFTSFRKRKSNEINKCCISTGICLSHLSSKKYTAACTRRDGKCNPNLFQLSC